MSTAERAFPVSPLDSVETRKKKREQQRALWDEQRRGLPKTAAEARAYAQTKNRAAKARASRRPGPAPAPKAARPAPPRAVTPKAKGQSIDVTKVYADRREPAKTAPSSKATSSTRPPTFTELIANYYGGAPEGDAGLITSSGRGGR